MDCDYGNVEKVLNDRFKVHHLFRDTRHDSGDDSGYIVAISEKHEQFYLHIIPICVEGNIENLCLDEIELIQNGGFADYVLCDSIEDAQLKLNLIIQKLDTYLESEGDFAQYADEIQDFFGETMSLTDAEHLAAIMFPYSEYSQDKIALLNLSNTTYTPNFDNTDNR